MCSSKKGKYYPTTSLRCYPCSTVSQPFLAFSFSVRCPALSHISWSLSNLLCEWGFEPHISHQCIVTHNLVEILCKVKSDFLSLPFSAQFLNTLFYNPTPKVFLLSVSDRGDSYLLYLSTSESIIPYSF